MGFKGKFILHAALTMVVAACGSNAGTETGGERKEEKTGDFTLWTTTADARSLFSKNDKLHFENVYSTSGITLTGERLQSVDGFGMAVTQSSCYNLLKMSAADRTRFLREIFSREDGLGSSLIRVCIGGSDFSLSEFTWCDTEGIENFAVHRSDIEYLFPVLDEIYAINPDVKIIASPWSAPIWMKRGVNNDEPFPNWISGRLSPAHYSDYATYFVKWIQEMESRGYDIYAVTLQNEPLNKGNSMSMYMSWEEQRDFIKTAVGPAFREAGIKAKILLYDHNYDQSSYPLNIMKDSDAAQYVAGSAWHSYGGSVEVLGGVQKQFPDKEIYFTESSIGKWNHVNFGDNFIADFREQFMGVLLRGGKGSVVWNLMLDKEGKPYRPCGCSTCYGAVTIGSDYSYGSIVRNTQYYFVAHCSRVLQPGAVRLGTAGTLPSGISLAVFGNPDGSLAAIVMNQGGSAQYVTLSSEKHTIRYSFPAGSVSSILWED